MAKHNPQLKERNIQPGQSAQHDVATAAVPAANVEINTITNVMTVNAKPRYAMSTGRFWQCVVSILVILTALAANEWTGTVDSGLSVIGSVSDQGRSPARFSGTSLTNAYLSADP